MDVATAMRMGAVLAAFLPLPAMALDQAATSAEARPAPAGGADAATVAERKVSGQADAGVRATPLSDDVLAGNRGGENIVAGNQTLTAVTSGNTLNGGYVAGSVVLSDQALSNFNGIGNFAINTGAQVSIQSGMNLTINVAP